MLVHKYVFTQDVCHEVTSVMENIIYWAIGLVILIILVANVVMPTLKDANTTGWSTGEVVMWGAAGIVLIATVIITVSRGAR